MNDAVITIADGVTIERFGDIFFIGVEGCGSRTIRKDDEVVLFEMLNRLYIETVRE